MPVASWPVDIALKAGAGAGPVLGQAVALGPLEALVGTIKAAMAASNARDSLRNIKFGPLTHPLAMTLGVAVASASRFLALVCSVGLKRVCSTRGGAHDEARTADSSPQRAQPVDCDHVIQLGGCGLCQEAGGGGKC